MFRKTVSKYYTERVFEFKVYPSTMLFGAIKKHARDFSLKLEMLVKIKFVVKDNKRTFIGWAAYRWVAKQFLLVVFLAR